MNPQHRQSAYAVRCEWGLDGARAVGENADIVVVVDVLSFTTCVAVAVERDIEVYPHRWRDDSAASLAREHDAVLAVGRSDAGPGEVSLSPSSIRAATGVRRLVLPSPNGSTIVHALSQGGATVLAASLRNARAVGEWIAQRPGATVAVIPSGERWPDGALRPAVEDLWGAGAVIDGLPGRLSPEAETARAAWRSVSAAPADALRGCASGRELIALGFGDDVEVAGEVGVTTVVPVLDGGRFRAG
ncbi:putative 2-phosphosulfolactate phosphatase [Tsukamurella strandjordii]